MYKAPEPIATLYRMVTTEHIALFIGAIGAVSVLKAVYVN